MKALGMGVSGLSVHLLKENIMKNASLRAVGHPGFVRRSGWTLLKLGIRLGMMAACVLILAPVANTQETRPPLKGGAKYWEPEGVKRPPLKGRVEQSEGICDRYGADINPFEGRLHVVPKTGQGRRDYCYVSFPNWRLLGEAGNYCCYFAPNEWVPKIPPTPEPPPPDEPTGDLGCRGTYTECFGDKRLPWEQPAQAQSDSDFVDSFTLTVVWKEQFKDSGTDDRGYYYESQIQREGRCEVQIEFYKNGKAKFKKFTYFNKDTSQNSNIPNQRNVETLNGSTPGVKLFDSELTIKPKGNGLYDISWTTPRLQPIYQNDEIRSFVNGRWVTTRETGPYLTAKVARCVGQVSNEGSRSGINYQLLGVRLQRGNDLPQYVKTKILKELEKQAPNATVMVYWDFQ